MKTDKTTFQDGLHDGQALMKFIAARIIDHELKSWGANTNAARALKDVKKKIIEHTDAKPTPSTEAGEPKP